MVSLLRIQERRTQSPEAKKVLHESVNRIMAIAATHELLSKQVKDDVALRQTLEAVMYNFRHLFQGAQPIEMMMMMLIQPLWFLANKWLPFPLLSTNYYKTFLIMHLSHKQVALLN